MTEVTQVSTRRKVKFTANPKKSDVISIAESRLKYCQECGCRLCETEAKGLQQVLEILKPLVSSH